MLYASFYCWFWNLNIFYLFYVLWETVCSEWHTVWTWLWQPVCHVRTELRLCTPRKVLKDLVEDKLFTEDWSGV